MQTKIENNQLSVTMFGFIDTMRNQVQSHSPTLLRGHCKDRRDRCANRALQFSEELRPGHSGGNGPNAAMDFAAQGVLENGWHLSATWRQGIQQRVTPALPAISHALAIATHLLDLRGRPQKTGCHMSGQGGTGCEGGSSQKLVSLSFPAAYGRRTRG